MNRAANRLWMMVPLSLAGVPLSSHAELPVATVDFNVVMSVSYREQPITIARSGNLVRQDFGDDSLPVVILDIVTGEALVLDGTDRTATRMQLPVSESPLDPLAGARMWADDTLAMEHIGSSAVLDHECEIHRASATHNGEPFTFDICLSSAHNIALRTVVRGLQGMELESEAVEFSVGTPDAALFEVPAGYALVDDE